MLILTAPFDGEASPRKSNCWLLRCVGPEQASELRLLARDVTTDEADEGPIVGLVDVIEAASVD